MTVRPLAGRRRLTPTGRSSTTNDIGEFRVFGLPPGQYYVSATMRTFTVGDSGDSDDRTGYAPTYYPGTPNVAEAQRVTVGLGQTLGNINMALIATPTATVVTATGRIVVSDLAAAEMLRPTSIQVAATPANRDDLFAMMGGGGGAVKDDFSFELKSPPALMNLRIAPQLPGWTLKAVRLNGADLTDTGIDFASRADFSGIEVELTNRPQEVSGVVANARGVPVKDYSVILFSQDREKWTGPSRHMAIGRPDQDGRFIVRSLPPGRYYAVALDYVDPDESSDPEFLERIFPMATTLSLGDGETKTPDLKLNSAS